MKFKKEKMSKEEWVFEVGGYTLPLGQFFRPILIVVLMLDLSFQFGVYTQEIVKFTSYMAEDGMYDETSSLFFKCRPELDDNYVKWNCNLQKQTSNKIYPDNFIPTQNDLNVPFYNNSSEP